MATVLMAGPPPYDKIADGVIIYKFGSIEEVNTRKQEIELTLSEKYGRKDNLLAELDALAGEITTLEAEHNSLTTAIAKPDLSVTVTVP